MSLNNIRIVLIETSHPGNIGSAARAMLTMGLTDLYLVNPARYPDKQATIMASGADRVLDSATIVSSLSEAIADCHIVIGTSARDQRYIQWPLMDARNAGEFIAQHSSEGKTAIVFGRESSGLTNEELEYCQRLVSIPVNPEFRSLNIASAVQVLSYECAIALKSIEDGNIVNEDMEEKMTDALATVADMEAYYQHLEETLVAIRYLEPGKPRLLLRKLRSFYARTQPKKSELNMLRGILSATQGSKFLPRNQRKQ